MQFLGFSRNYSVIERAQAVAASPTVLFSDLTTTERRKIINWPTYDCITTISCGGDQYCGYNGEEVCGSICEDGLWVESQAVGGRRGGDVSAGVVLWFFCILFFFGFPLVFCIRKRHRVVDANGQITWIICLYNKAISPARNILQLGVDFLHAYFDCNHFFWRCLFDETVYNKSDPDRHNPFGSRKVAPSFVNVTSPSPSMTGQAETAAEFTVSPVK